MIEAIMFSMLFLLAGSVIYLLSRIDAGAKIMLPGSRILRQNTRGISGFLGQRIPTDATHIAWIMLGEGEAGRVHTLYLQALKSVRDDITSANSPWGPIIAHSIELECDIRSRGCIPTTEIMWAVVKVDANGNEQWLNASGWGARWQEGSMFEVFPNQVR